MWTAPCRIRYPIAMPQSLANVLVHVVFSTKGRQPLLAHPPLRLALHRYLAMVSSELGCPAITVGGVEDHVHVLARQGRTVTIAGWVRELKRVSSVWLKEQPRGLSGFLWQGGYGAFSVSQSQSAAVERYIARQEARHLRLTFEEELRALLARNQIAYDDRYLWEWTRVPEVRKCCGRRPGEPLRGTPGLCGTTPSALSRSADGKPRERFD